MNEVTRNRAHELLGDGVHRCRPIGDRSHTWLCDRVADELTALYREREALKARASDARASANAADATCRGLMAALDEARDEAARYKAAGENCERQAAEILTLRGQLAMKRRR